MGRYVLDAATPVLLRPDGNVQLGWHPQRAVLVHPPDGLSAATLAELLRRLQSGATIAELCADCRAADPAGVEAVVESLARIGRVTTGVRRRTRSASIRLHGRGPISDLLAASLRCSGARVQHSSRSHAVARRDTDLVVLTDYLVADPRVVRDLHAARMPHLPVRVRDGTGLIGPLVLPGLTSCLACADLHRTDRDAAWPAVAAQLRGTVGTADRATVLATAALALNQVDRVIGAVLGRSEQNGPAPPTLDTTLEFDVHTQTIVARRWSRHPRCPC